MSNKVLKKTFKTQNLNSALCLNCGQIHQPNSHSFNLSQIENFQTVVQAQTKTKGSSRRQFIKRAALSASLVTLTNCYSPFLLENQDSTFLNLEKRQLKIGFVPVLCATPLVIAKFLGFYEKYGLDVELVQMESWTQIRDAASAEELDAYHMLSPMPIAMNLGLGSRRHPIKLASIQNINGNAITVAMKHRDKVKNPEDFKGFTIAIPFEYSIPNLLLRYYLAAGKVHPDRDVNLIVLPPGAMLERLETGEIDAMIVGEPYNQLAVSQGVGFLHLLTRDLWLGHPCCSFTASQTWIDQHPSTFRAVNKAMIEASNYVRLDRNRREAARILANSEYFNFSEEVMQTVLSGQFVDGLGNIRTVLNRIDFDPYPWKSFSYWITSQFVRWNLLNPQQANHEEIADQVFLSALARQLSKQLNQTPPTVILRYEQLKFDVFDPSEPAAYVQQQIQRYGF